jgi:small conductance mechanosensitive channel
MELQTALETVRLIAVEFGLKVIGALLLWWLGRWLIGFGVRLLTRALTARDVDPTLQRYLASIVGVLLNIVLIIGILGFFGIETTSFAALMAAAGVAIGAAWAGLLSNFAAGAFLILLRPFKVGDAIEAGGTAGTVAEIGLFATRIVAADNVSTLVGNTKLLGDNIRNFSATRFRRIERTVVVPTGMPLHEAVARLKASLAATPNVLADPAPSVALVDLVDGGVQVSVRLAAPTEHYGSVLDEVNRIVCTQFGPPDLAAGRTERALSI